MSKHNLLNRWLVVLINRLDSISTFCFKQSCNFVTTRQRRYLLWDYPAWFFFKLAYKIRKLQLLYLIREED